MPGLRGGLSEADVHHQMLLTETVNSLQLACAQVHGVAQVASFSCRPGRRCTNHYSRFRRSCAVSGNLYAQWCNHLTSEPCALIFLGARPDAVAVLARGPHSAAQAVRRAPAHINSTAPASSTLRLQGGCWLRLSGHLSRYVFFEESPHFKSTRIRHSDLSVSTVGGLSPATRDELGV